MELKFSKNNVPFIEFDEENFLIFSVLLEKSEGFKYLSYSGKIETSARIRKANKIQTIYNTERVGFSTDLKFSKIPRDISKVHLTVDVCRYLRKIFKRHNVDGYIPRTNLKALGNDLEKLTILLEKKKEKEKKKAEKKKRKKKSWKKSA